MKILKAAAAVIGCFALTAAAEEAHNAPGAIMRGLDTITGQVSQFELAAGATRQFGRMSIQLDQCRYHPENPATNSYAFVRIRDILSDKIMFNAWMIASAPALSAMDHPRYDFWLIRCKTDELASGSG